MSSNVSDACEKCGKTFKGKRGLTMHMKVCEGTQNLVCEFCNKNFSSIYSLSIHSTRCTEVKKQKQDQLEAQVTQEFAAKKSGTAPGGDALKHLALWLDNPPFKSNNVQLKRETFLAILNFIGQLKPD